MQVRLTPAGAVAQLPVIPCGLSVRPSANRAVRRQPNGHDVRCWRVSGIAWEDNFVKQQENGWRDLLKSLP